MTTTIRYPVGDAIVTIQCQTVKEAIKELSEYGVVFGESKCEMCQSEQVIPTYKLAKGYDFYEMTCTDCGASLSFGQTKEGERLFPKRKDKDGNAIGKFGWHQYQSQNDDRF
jgi:translation initiation factor 2 beta subunit (eIF-2beta)/eIF-5